MIKTRAKQNQNSKITNNQGTAFYAWSKTWVQGDITFLRTAKRGRHEQEDELPPPKHDLKDPLEQKRDSGTQDNQASPSFSIVLELRYTYLYYGDETKPRFPLSLSETNSTLKELS